MALNSWEIATKSPKSERHPSFRMSVMLVALSRLVDRVFSRADLLRTAKEHRDPATSRRRPLPRRTFERHMGQLKREGILRVVGHFRVSTGAGRPQDWLKVDKAAIRRQNTSLFHPEDRVQLVRLLKRESAEARARATRDDEYGRLLAETASAIEGGSHGL